MACRAVAMRAALAGPSTTASPSRLMLLGAPSDTSSSHFGAGHPECFCGGDPGSQVWVQPRQRSGCEEPDLLHPTITTPFADPDASMRIRSSEHVEIRRRMPYGESAALESGRFPGRSERVSVLGFMFGRRACSRTPSRDHRHRHRRGWSRGGGRSWWRLVGWPDVRVGRGRRRPARAEFARTR